MEDIFSGLIYEVALGFAKNIYQELPLQSQGGLIEYIIYETVKNTKMFLNNYVEKIEILDNFVPNSFFIQNYSSRKTDTLKVYIEDNKKYKRAQKKDLPKCKIFFNQKQFTGKYYDCGLLVPDIKKGSGYKLILFQISKKKISSDIYFREEHQLIMNRVKKKIENEFNIKINEGYFSYILSEEDKDKETIEFCDNNNLYYIFFSVANLEFKGLEEYKSIFNEKSFITKNFPYHNSFSILSSNNFKIKNKKLENYDYIESIEKQLNEEKISQQIENDLNKYFIPKHDLEKDEKNQFYIYGHFDNAFPVNPSFCRWLNNKNQFFYYYNKENEYKKTNFIYKNIYSSKNFTLICSKYKIKNK